MKRSWHPKSRRAKATKVDPNIKLTVWKRDNYRCVKCGSPYGTPNAHFIAASQNGRGNTPENILTLCPNCHYEYDNTPKREELREQFRRYLKSKYPNWDESKLYYKKYAWEETNEHRIFNRSLNP